MSTHRTILLYTAAVTLALGAAPAVHAQSADRVADDGSEVSDADGDIIVTATKRRESAQRVPIALSAFSGDDLQTRGISSPADLQRSVPSLSFGTQQNNPGITMDVSIRGVSSPNSLPGGDPGVPVHMNGHYLQATNFLVRDLLDIERIEVLRGPQGTLYGRNANGGSVNIITKQPTGEFEALVSLEVGNYDLMGVQGVVNIPVSERIRMRFAGAHKYRQGYIRNVNPASSQRHILDIDYVSGRGQIDIDLSDTLTTRFGGYYYLNHGQLAAFQLTTFGPINTTGSPYYQALPAGSRFQSDLDPRTVDYDQRLDGRDKAYGYNFSADWDLGAVVFKAMAAHNFSSSEVPLDLDNTSNPDALNSFNNFVEYKTDTAEIQILSGNSNRFNWVLGANYYNENSLLTNPFMSPPSMFGVYFYTAPFAFYHARAYGAFGNAEYKVTDKLHLFAGVRYNRDSKSIAVANIQVFDPALIPDPDNVLAIPRDPHGFPLFRESATFQSVNFRAGANYFFREGLMVYGSVSTGYRPGGFNADSTSSSLYGKETTTAYEIGLKSSFFDRRLTLNMSAYRTDYKDRQESRTIGVPAIGPDGQQIGLDFRSDFTNVPKSRIYGLEIESSLNVTQGLRLDFSLGYIDAKITSNFIGTDQFRPDLGLDTNFKGNRLPWTPKIKYNIGLQYEFALAGGTVTARGDYSFTDNQFSEYFNRTPQNTASRPEGIISNYVPSYDSVNLALGWKSEKLGLRIEGAVTNLLNDTDIVSIKPAFQASAGTNTNWVDYSAPRMYSVKLTKQF